MQSSSRRYESSPGSLVAIVAASVAVHVVVLLALYLGEDAPVKRRAALANKSESEPAAAPDRLSMTCQGDVVLAVAARVASCALPTAQSGCLDHLAIDYDGWLMECDAMLVMERERDDAKKRPVRIAFLDDKALAKLEPIPVMPLLDPVQQQKLIEQKKKRIITKIAQQRQAQKKIAQQKKAVEAQKKKAQPKPPPPQRVARAQVVEITKPTEQEPPKNTRFVSEFNSSVKKETVARASTEKMVKRPGAKELPVADEQKPPDRPMAPKPPVKLPPKSDIENPNGTGALAMRRPGPRRQEISRVPLQTRTPGVADGSRDPLSANGLAPRRGERRRKARRFTEQPAGGDGGRAGEQGRPKVPNLRPSKELISRVVGGGSVDKLDGVQRGEGTALNARRWKYASFFNRMKRQVAQNWRPNRVFMRRDPRGNVYGVKDRITVVRVILRAKGSLVSVVVAKPSGVEVLDEEAMRAFRAAQPFPNPPGGLVDKDGNISFAFGFHVNVGGNRGAWKVFRSR